MSFSFIVAHKWAVIFFLPSLMVMVFPVLAGTVRVIDAGGGLMAAQVTSLKELRFKATVKQEHDFSCGSAALATLLTYHYDDPVTEDKVFKAMFERGNKEKIEREGFSLLDMKRYLEANGYHSDGYVTNLSKVAKVGKPVIVLINNGGYLHFVVIKGIDDEKVLIGDPATGARTLPRKDFEAIWNKLVFVIHENTQLARNAFNKETDWKIREKSPLGAALSRESLGAFSLMAPSLDGSSGGF
ncbi:MAG: C39 family peptidase [Methyloglobulus sp.]|nr:C39 family peptidase [Methyloglobulus sp.]